MDIQAISVCRDMRLREALEILDKTGSGILILLDKQAHFERTITDGDLRRLILAGVQLDNTLSQLEHIQSVVVRAGTPRRVSLGLMKKHGIYHIPVINRRGNVIAVLNRKVIDDQILLSTPHMGDDEKFFIDEAFRTNWVAPLGPNVDAFESEIAAHVGIKEAAALCSGTAAIHLALLLLGVRQGDKVFCSSLTFVASANPIIYQGAEPVFIDAEPCSWNMSPQALEAAFFCAYKEGWMPKAVIIVNLYGQSADMDCLLPICAHYGVPVVEDAAESLGARYKGKASGTFGQFGIYSFNGNKIITTSGGGMLISEDKQLIARARFLATQARDPAPHYEHSEIGYNYRMSNLLAGVGRGQLNVLQKRVNARRALFYTYQRVLSDISEIEWMPEPEWSYSTHWLTACTLKSKKNGLRDKLLQSLADELIEGRPIWKPMHLQPIFRHCRYFSHSAVSVSDKLFEHGLCLPSGSNMTELQIDRVVTTLRKALRAKSRAGNIAFFPKEACLAPVQG